LLVLSVSPNGEATMNGLNIAKAVKDLDQIFKRIALSRIWHGARNWK